MTLYRRIQGNELNEFNSMLQQHPFAKSIRIHLPLKYLFQKVNATCVTVTPQDCDWIRSFAQKEWETNDCNVYVTGIEYLQQFYICITHWSINDISLTQMLDSFFIK